MHVSGFDVLLRFFRILVLRKRMIFIVTILPTVICVVVVFTSKSKYKAEALIKPPASESGSSIPEALKESGAGGLLGSFLGGTETGENDCMSILKSALFGKLIVDRFDLETAYKFKQAGKSRKYYVADVIKEFQRNANFELTDEDAIKIGMVDESPERASEIVSSMIHVLDSLYADIQKKANKERLGYVDYRLALAEIEMKSMEDSLVAFQNRNNLIVPEAQVRLILENATQTEVQVETLKEQLALEAALRGTSSAQYHDLSVQKDLLQRTLQHQLRNSGDSNTLILPAHALPALAAEYFRLERAYNVKLGVYKYLIQQVEALKLEANKNIRVISVLDPPWPNDKRVFPKRRVMVEAVFILFFILASVIAVLQAVWSRHQEENPETGRLVEDIKKNLLRF